MRALRFGLLFCLLAASAACGSRPPAPPLSRVVTLAGEGPHVAPSGLSDPFGVAVTGDGTVFVTDGAGGRVYRIARDGAAPVAEGLDMPSGVAVAPDGTLVVADTGAHTIARVDPATGAVATLAGAAGARGFADGPAGAARFDGPVGVAVGADGTVFVADTYNDRVRAIGPDGTVRTIAGGGGPGFADGPAAEARFDTPCGLAVAPDGALVVADTGNRSIRRVAPDGAVSTVFGAESFDEPTAIAVRTDGSLLVADAAGSCVRLCEPGAPAPVRRFAGGPAAGRADGDLGTARFSRPTGVAIAPGGEVVVADGPAGAVRAVVAAGFDRGRVVADPVALLDTAELRAAVAPRWPYDPPDRPREVAATFGEVRSEGGEEGGVWLHNALDIPGGAGEMVYAVFTERVTRPIAAAGAGERSERLRLPVFAYVHVRVGRDARDQPLEGSPFELLRDASGAVTRVRVRRGATIEAGRALGVLNKYNHVHLSLGPPGAELNPLTVFALPGFADTVAPVIEDVAVATEAGEVLGEVGDGPTPTPIAARGRVRVLVRAWDRNDRSAERRRLGLFRLGYQLLDSVGEPAPGYEQPRVTISFERLPADPEAGRLAFAAGSRAWFTGPTTFVYEATNVVRDGEARAELLDLSALAPGRYTLRVTAEDAAGNRATRDVLLNVEA